MQGPWLLFLLGGVLLLSRCVSVEHNNQDVSIPIHSLPGMNSVDEVHRVERITESAVQQFAKLGLRLRGSVSSEANIDFTSVNPLDKCSTLGIQSCENCLPNVGCGWCAASSKCLAGNNVSDLASTCEGEKWLFNECEEPCENFNECTSCTGKNHCGWCHDINGIGQCQDKFDVCEMTTAFEPQSCPPPSFDVEFPDERKTSYRQDITPLSVHSQDGTKIEEARFSTVRNRATVGAKARAEARLRAFENQTKNDGLLPKDVQLAAVNMAIEATRDSAKAMDKIRENERHVTIFKNHDDTKASVSLLELRENISKSENTKITKTLQPQTAAEIVEKMLGKGNSSDSSGGDSGTTDSSSSSQPMNVVSTSKTLTSMETDSNESESEAVDTHTTVVSESIAKSAFDKGR
eukprot:g1064.t1